MDPDGKRDVAVPTLPPPCAWMTKSGIYTVFLAGLCTFISSFNRMYGTGKLEAVSPRRDTAPTSAAALGVYKADCRGCDKGVSDGLQRNARMNTGQIRSNLVMDIHTRGPLVCCNTYMNVFPWTGLNQVLWQCSISALKMD